MDREHEALKYELFQRAIELPAAARDAWLDSQQTPPEVRAEVRRLLRYHGTPTEQLPKVDATPVVIPAFAQLAPPESIGPYRVLSVIGSGGYGVVYLGERLEPIRQQVAIKLPQLLPWTDTASVISRFEHERRSLASLDHPNIAKIFDADKTEDGRPYFIMEYVSGEPLTKYCDSRRLGIEERLRLFIPVCEAVHHAHQRGLIHRDIKPSNLLVTEFDGRPVAKVIDFGIAKALDPLVAGNADAPKEGALPGTPEYMCPEQAGGTTEDIDTRADVYSLGVVLYELVCGMLPFDPKELREGSSSRVNWLIIREVEPPSPSRRLRSAPPEVAAELAASRSTPPAALAALLARELEWIPKKAMRKDRKERYDSAKDLASDIRNYLELRPLAAAPESRWYRARKFARRNRVLVGAATISVAAMLAATSVSTWFFWRERDALRESESTLGFVSDVLGAPNPDEGTADIRVVDVLNDAKVKLEKAMERSLLTPQAGVRSAVALGRSYTGVGEFKKAEEILRRAVELAADSLPESKWHDDARLALCEALFRQDEGSAAASYLEPLYKTAAIRRRLNSEQLESVREMLAGAYKHWDPKDKGTALVKLDEAERLYSQVLESRRARLGSDHEQVLLTRYNLALVPVKRRQLTGDDGHLTKALAELQPLRKELELRKDKPAWLAMWLDSEIASVLYRLGRYTEAEPHYQRAIAGMQVTLDQKPVPARTNWRTAEAMGNYGRTLEQLHRSKEALPQFEAAWTSIQSTSDRYKSGHEDRIKAQYRLAHVLCVLDRVEEGRKYLEDAWRELNEAGVPEDRRREFAAKVVNELGGKLGTTEVDRWRSRESAGTK